MDSKKLIGNNISKLRKEANMSQEDLAKILNVTRQAVSNWERDKTEPSIEMIEKIGEVFNTDMNSIIKGNFNNAKKTCNGDYSKIIYLASILMFVLYLVFFIKFSKIENNLGPVIFLGVIVLVETSIYFIFGNAIKTENFTMLAGYNSKIVYNVPTLIEVVSTMKFFILVDSLIIMWIFIGLSFADVPGVIFSIIFYVYLINFFLIIFVTNFKYLDQMFINKIDRIIIKKSMSVSIVFIISVFVLILGMYIGMEIFNIQNNTATSFKNLLFFFPYLILNVTWLFKESKKVDKTIREGLEYKLSKSTYILIVLNILLIIGIFYNCYINKAI